MSEQTPQLQLSAKASRDVDNAFDPEHRKAQAEWNAYLDSRPYESKKSNAKDPESGKKIDSDEYFDKKREEHADKSNKAYENMTPFELTRKIAEAKFHGDKTIERNLYDALLDKIDQEENKPEDEKNLNPQRDSRDLYAEYDYRIDEIFQQLHEQEQAKNPLLKNVDKLVDDATDTDDTTTIVKPSPIPPTDPSDVVGGDKTPGTDLVLREPLPSDPAEKKKWYKKYGKSILAGVAIGAGTGVLFFAGSGLFGNDKDNKNNQRDDTDEKTEQTQGQDAQSSAEHDKFMSQFRVNRADDHDRNKTVSSGFEKNDTANEALEQLKKNFGHHPVLLAESVYAYENGISVDKARENVDEINKMAESFVNGNYLNAEGRKWAEKLGKSVDNGKARWVTQDEMNHANWYNSGIEENGTFDKFFINDNAGFKSEKILRVTLGNGKVIYLKQNCINFLWKDQAETEVISNTPTTQNHIDQTDESIGEIDGTGPEFDPVPEIDDDKKSKEDINANTNLNEQQKVNEQVPAGDSKPATQPGPTYTPPAPPQAPETPRPTPPPTQETGTPPQNNPATGTTTKP